MGVEGLLGVGVLVNTVFGSISGVIVSPAIQGVCLRLVSIINLEDSHPHRSKLPSFLPGHFEDYIQCLLMAPGYLMYYFM